jgi:hypothetical protein
MEKETAVIPIFKKGNSAIMTNYRPISVLNIFLQTFLKIMIIATSPHILN